MVLIGFVCLFILELFVWFCLGFSFFFLPIHYVNYVPVIFYLMVRWSWSLTWSGGYRHSLELGLGHQLCLFIRGFECNVKALQLAVEKVGSSIHDWYTQHSKNILRFLLPRLSISRLKNTIILGYSTSLITKGNNSVLQLLEWFLPIL